jgi:CHASE3 domain sensor protein
VELNTLINRQNARLEASLSDAQSQAKTATIIAVVAVILGIAGIGLALAKRRA